MCSPLIVNAIINVLGCINDFIHAKKKRFFLQYIVFTHVYVLSETLDKKKKILYTTHAIEITITTIVRLLFL